MSNLVLFEKIKGNFGFFGHITLNRPQALNALNLEMILALERVLEECEKDPEVLAVILTSSSEKAFCAGGDIRALYEAGLQKDADVFNFFKREYHLNHRIFHYSKPYISFLNGLTMGGGVGISLHGAFCVAGNNFRFAMPETAIGFFPDIGGSYLLNRCPGAYGVYLGLTGARVDRDEAYALKLVNYCIDAEVQSEVMNQLYTLDLRANGCDKVSQLLTSFHQSPQTESIFKRLPWVNEAFGSQSSVENIIKALDLLAMNLDEPSIKKTLADLKLKSPMSLKITFELLNRTRSKTLDESLVLDYILVHHFLQDKDFYEGVRALIVDKDNQPRWEPSTLEVISEERVNSYFHPIHDVDSHHNIGHFFRDI